MNSGLPSVASMSALTKSLGAIFIADQFEQVRELVRPRGPLSGRLSKLRKPIKTRERTGKRMLAINFGVAIRTDQQNRIRGNEVRDVAQHRDRAAIGPVQIVENQDQRACARNGDQKLRNRIEEAKAFVFLVDRSRLRNIPNRVVQRRCDAREDRRALSDDFGELLRRFARVTEDRLGKRTVGWMPFAVVTRAVTTPPLRAAAPDRQTPRGCGFCRCPAHRAASQPRRAR